MANEPVSVVFKVYCLSVMTMVAATYTLVLRYTRTISSTAMYFSTTAVCVTEVIKLFLSLGMLTKEAGSFGRLKASIVEHVFQCPKELLKLSVPSVVYAIQNNMAFIALSNLDAAVYQVTYQLKIPCTALCMVLMLNRSLSRLQWLSVCMLCGGVALVQWKPAEATKVQVEQNPFWGFMAIAIAVFCSGFAGVYFEKVLKSSDTSLWVRNIQLYMSGIVVTLAVVYMTEGTQQLSKIPIPKPQRARQIFMQLSSVQCGWFVHISGGEVHRQYHERLLCCSRHRSLYCGICRSVWATNNC
ncbi:CMP-sialic acid transporter-like isoform X4 [Oncorhynchus keta]|uniref:CMP-sialic acid transporter-like isoform X4 n=1 Tax=Oncorhynchus keta TaxID=8018 RepID=UPI0015FB09CB|nr:CMP-sialic acid transporter-like isoform X4 [Oncorhynchus keta]